jgi:hypothetical protein
MLGSVGATGFWENAAAEPAPRVARGGSAGAGAPISVEAVGELTGGAAEESGAVGAKGEGIPITEKATGETPGAGGVAGCAVDGGAS